MYLFRIFTLLCALLWLIAPQSTHAQHIEQLFDEDASLDLSDSLYYLYAVSYTHLTLPTNREV